MSETKKGIHITVWLALIVSAGGLIYKIYFDSSNELEEIQFSNIEIDYSYSPKFIHETLVNVVDFPRTKGEPMSFRTIVYPLTFKFVISNLSEEKATFIDGDLEYYFSRHFSIPLRNQKQNDFLESGLYDNSMEKKIEFPFEIPAESAKALKILINIPILSESGFNLLNEKNITIDSIVLGIGKGLENPMDSADSISISNSGDTVKHYNSQSISKMVDFAKGNLEMFDRYELNKGIDEIVEILALENRDLFGVQKSNERDKLFRLEIKSQKKSIIKALVEYKNGDTFSTTFISEKLK